jgi:hypothetical protein
VLVLQKCGQVLGLELLAQAVDDARSNAENNGITNCDFFVGKAEDILCSVMNRAVKEDILAVVDPPRAGLRKDFILLNIFCNVKLYLCMPSPHLPIVICFLFPDSITVHHSNPLPLNFFTL